MGRVEEVVGWRWLWPFGKNEKAGRTRKQQADLEKTSTLRAPNSAPDFPLGFFYFHQSWHKTFVSRTLVTHLFTKSSEQALVEVIVLILQIMELKPIIRLRDRPEVTQPMEWAKLGLKQGSLPDLSTMGLLSPTWLGFWGELTISGDAVRSLTLEVASGCADISGNEAAGAQAGAQTACVPGCG